MASSDQDVGANIFPVAWRAKINAHQYVISSFFVEVENWNKFGYTIEPLYTLDQLKELKGKSE
jgi:hypothetical protein